MRVDELHREDELLLLDSVELALVVVVLLGCGQARAVPKKRAAKRLETSIVMYVSIICKVQVGKDIEMFKRTTES